MYTDLTYSVGGFLQDISSEGSKGSALSRWRITGEDPLHVRKALGILCLASFLWRFGQIGDTTDMGFASHPNLTLRLPTLLLHLMLNLLSIDFRIPRKRIDFGLPNLAGI
jgi:hypothetical protein